MARNRKTQSVAVRTGLVVKALLICILIGASGVGYVSQKDQLNQLSRRKVDLEKRLEWLHARGAQAYGQWMQLRSPPALEARVKELGLGLVEPAPSQIVRLADTPLAGTIWPSGRNELEYAKQQHHSGRERTP
jgi:hypothetical protein